MRLGELAMQLTFAILHYLFRKGKLEGERGEMGGSSLLSEMPLLEANPQYELTQL